MGLRLTRAADYAVRAMLHLGSLPEGGVALKDEIAHAQNIPPSFMAKILRQLVKTGLLRSARGVNGGFGLQRPAAEINLLDIIEGIADIKVDRKYNLDAPQGVRGRNSDNTLIKSTLGWEPGIDLKTGLELTYPWIEEQLLRRSRGEAVIN